jgi:16S rRNA (guanine527-N7)-methyltransferase
LTEPWDREAAGLRLAAALDALALRAAPTAPHRLLDLCELLCRWAARINLTGHRTADDVLDRLVLDALALASMLPPAARIADLGAGAGFPGLPLAILFPEVRVTLVEARERKHHFQREAVRQLALKNARPLLGRSDVLPPEPHDGVVAQAMARPSEAVAQLLPWAAPGGWLAIPGGEVPPSIVRDDVLLGGIRRYAVPITGIARTVWIGRKPATKD